MRPPQSAHTLSVLHHNNQATRVLLVSFKFWIYDTPIFTIVYTLAHLYKTKSQFVQTKLRTLYNVVNKHTTIGCNPTYKLPVSERQLFSYTELLWKGR